MGIHSSTAEHATSWHWKTFKELTINELYDILALREKIFIVEQKCIYRDIDDLDKDALHLLGTKNSKLVSYLRLFPKGILYPDKVNFGRVLTEATERGNGLAKEAMKQVALYLNKSNEISHISISAQTYLVKFYESFGLNPVGEPYSEDGIPHIEMIGNFLPINE